jgi:hypothetical protein
MLWAINEKSGKGNPLDPEPVPDGNVIPTGETHEDGRMYVRNLHKGEEPPPGTPRYVSHFATCPNAEEFRKP